MDEIPFDNWFQSIERTLLECLLLRRVVFWPSMAQKGKKKRSRFQVESTWLLSITACSSHDRSVDVRYDNVTGNPPQKTTNFFFFFKAQLQLCFTEFPFFSSGKNYMVSFLSLLNSRWRERFAPQCGFVQPTKKKQKKSHQKYALGPRKRILLIV